LAETKKAIESEDQRWVIWKDAKTGKEIALGREQPEKSDVSRLVQEGRMLPFSLGTIVVISLVL